MPNFGMRSPNRGVIHLDGKKASIKDFGETLKKLWPFMREQKALFIQVIIFTLFATILQLAAPLLMAQAIDKYVLKADWHGLIKLSCVLAAIYLCNAWFSFLSQRKMVDVAMLTTSRLRHALMSKIQRLPIPFFDKQSHGQIMSRVTNDMENVSSTLTQTATGIISSILSLVGSIALMLYMNVWLTLLCMVTIPLVLLVTRFITTHTKLYFTEQQASLGHLNGFIAETVRGKKEMMIASREKYALEQFVQMNHMYTNAAIKANIYSGLVGPCMNVLNHLSFIAISVVGGVMAFHSATSIGTIVAFINYSKQFQRPINELANQYNMIQAGIAGAERVFKLYETKEEEIDPTNGKCDGQPFTLIGKVEFRQVDFSYNEERKILTDISFTTQPGQTFALVGPTGAGKTSIINLLTRFYDVNDGEILIDDQPINSYQKEAFRKQLGVVLQDTYLFAGTIFDNIRYGKLDATDEEVILAAKTAHAHRFISDLENGYHSLLTAGGSNLSQGQRQLITIARALLASPSILILDEATSNIDTRTEMYVQNGIKALLKNRTSFVIAHRLSTIQDADTILYIDQGQIKEVGNHEHLMKEKGLYFDLYNSQFMRSK